VAACRDPEMPRQSTGQRYASSPSSCRPRSTCSPPARHQCHVELPEMRLAVIGIFALRMVWWTISPNRAPPVPSVGPLQHFRDRRRSFRTLRSTAADVLVDPNRLSRRLVVDEMTSGRRTEPACRRASRTASLWTSRQPAPAALHRSRSVQGRMNRCRRRYDDRSKAVGPRR